MNDEMTALGPRSGGQEDLKFSQLFMEEAHLGVTDISSWVSVVDHKALWRDEHYGINNSQETKGIHLPSTDGTFR
jgi:hypothetical protein